MGRRGLTMIAGGSLLAGAITRDPSALTIADLARRRVVERAPLPASPPTLRQPNSVAVDPASGDAIVAGRTARLETIAGGSP